MLKEYLKFEYGNPFREWSIYYAEKDACIHIGCVSKGKLYFVGIIYLLSKRKFNKSFTLANLMNNADDASNYKESWKVISNTSFILCAGW